MSKKILLGLVSLISIILLIFIVFFAYLQFADLNHYKPQISQRLSQYLGRSVVLDGNFDIKLIPLSLSLSDARIANAQWGSTPNMLDVQQLDLQVELLPLFSGEFLISKFILDDVQVVVEHSEQGENNWGLFEAKESKTKIDSEPTTLPLDFVPDIDIEIKNIALLYSQSPTSPKHKFMLNKASISGLSVIDALRIDASGQVDGHIFNVTGKIGALKQLLSADEKFPMELQAHALNAEWQIKGHIRDVLKLQQMQLSAKVSTKDLSEWRQWLGVNIDSSPVNVRADIEGDLKKLSVSNLVVQLGNAEAKGDLEFDASKEKPVISGSLNINNIHAEDFLDADQREPDNASNDTKQVAKEELSNKDLDLLFLKLFDSTVTLSATSVGFQDWMVDELDADIIVKDGSVSVAPFSIASRLGQAKGTFNLAKEQGVVVAKLDIEANDLALGKFFGMTSTYQGIGALQGSIHTKGKSWTDLYSNLQGNTTAHYVNKEHKHDTKIVLTRISPKTTATPFDVDITGELQQVPYKITGEIGGPMALIDEKPYPATAQLQFLNVDAKAKGTIARLFRAEGFEIAFNARTENLAKLNQKINIGLPDLRKTEVRAVLRGNYSNLKFDKINAKTNSAQVTGNVQLNLKEKPLNITGDITLNKFDLTGVQKEIAAAHKVQNNEPTKSQESTLAKTMSFSALQGFNMNIKLNADENSSINLPNYPLSKLDASISVSNSVLSVSQLSVESPMGRITSEFTLDANKKVPMVEARIKSSDFDLEHFELDNDEQLFWRSLVGADVALRTQGETLRQWLEYVTGSVTLNYQHKQFSQTFALRLVREAQADVSTAPVSVRTNTKIGETTSQGFGSVSAPHTWLQGGLPTQLEFKANVKGYIAHVKGQIDNLVTGEGMNVRVSFDNRQSLTDSVDSNELGNRVGKVQLLAEIKGNYTNIIASQLNGVVGKGKISGSTTVNFREQPTAVEFDLDVDGLDISKWGTDDARSPARQKTVEKLFSDEKLPFGVLKAATIKGAINGNNIQFKRVLATKLDAAIDLGDGVLKLDLRHLLTNQGEFTARLHIDSNTTPPQVSLKLDVPTLNMAEFARNTEAEGLINGDFSAEISLDSAGNSIAALAAGLDGHMRLLMDKGTIDSALLNIYTGGVSAIVGTLTAANVKTTKVNCGICGLEFSKGKAVSEVVLLDTQHSTLVAEGWVDFASEKLSVKASPVNKGLRLNTDFPVIIQGSISNPKVSTQPTSALNTAAEIATVWFIPTTAIFIAYDGLRSGDKNPCVSMMAPTKESAGLRALKGAGKAVGDIGLIFRKGLSTLLRRGGEERSQEENASE